MVNHYDLKFIIDRLFNFFNDGNISEFSATLFYDEDVDWFLNHLRESTNFTFRVVNTFPTTRTQYFIKMNKNVSGVDKIDLRIRTGVKEEIIVSGEIYKKTLPL